MLDYNFVTYHYVFDNEELFRKASSIIAEGAVLGWFRGRMEYGPVLWKPQYSCRCKIFRNAAELNLKIKYREGSALCSCSSRRRNS